MNSVISEGLALMCIGMGTVLMFLCILILSMHVMSYFVAKLNKIFPEAVSEVKTAPISTNDDAAIAVAIAAAVARK